MNDAQQRVFFWVLLIAAPLAWLFVAVLFEKNAPAGFFGGTLAVLACVGATIFVRAGREQK